MRNEHKDEIAILLTIFGKIHLYNYLNLPKIDTPTAFICFVIASSRGHWEAHYYLSLMYFYGLDDFLEKDFLSQPGTHQLGRVWNTEEYMKTRNERLSFLHLYTSSLYGDERISAVISNKYIKVELVLIRESACLEIVPPQ